MKKIKNMSVILCELVCNLRRGSLGKPHDDMLSI